MKAREDAVVVVAAAEASVVVYDAAGKGGSMAVLVVVVRLEVGGAELRSKVIADADARGELGSLV